MALKKRMYDFFDLEEQDLKTAPSLDIPRLVVDKFLMPKDDGNYMLFLAHVKNSYRPKGGCPYCHSTDLKLEGRTKPRLIDENMSATTKCTASNKKCWRIQYREPQHFNCS